MTVELSFERDDDQMRSLAELWAMDEPWERGMGLGDCWPAFPLKFVIHGVEVIDLPRVSALNFALDLPRALSKAWFEGHAQSPVFEVDTLEVRRAGDRVRVHLRGARDRVGEASLEELLSAANGFAAEVRDYLLDYLPDLADDPDWGEWLRGRNEVVDPDDASSV